MFCSAKYSSTALRLPCQCAGRSNEHAGRARIGVADVLNRSDVQEDWGGLGPQGTAQGSGHSFALSLTAQKRPDLEIRVGAFRRKAEGTQTQKDSREAGPFSPAYLCVSRRTLHVYTTPERAAGARC